LRVEFRRVPNAQLQAGEQVQAGVRAQLKVIIAGIVWVAGAERINRACAGVGRRPGVRVRAVDLENRVKGDEIGDFSAGYPECRRDRGSGRSRVVS